MSGASGRSRASRSVPDAGKGVHQLGLMGAMEREEAAIEISAPVHGEGALEFQVIACSLLALSRPARKRLKLCDSTHCMP